MWIIAIDGYVATGKGTTAQGVARQLGFIYLDTGAMYRAVTLYAIQQWLLEADEVTKAQMMEQITIAFIHNPETDHDDILLNGMNVEKEIRQTDLSLRMKTIVTSPAVRLALKVMQRQFGAQGNIVADGRDMGTVVFPDANLKIFLVCDVEVRAQRRYDQLVSQGIVANLDTIRHDIAHRDDIDYSVAKGVNRMADDAIIIDTTHLTIEQQIERVIELYNHRHDRA